MTHPDASGRRRLPGTARHLLAVVSLAATLAATLGGCAVPIVQPQRFEHAAAPEIHTILLLEPRFVHRSALTDSMTAVPTYGGIMPLVYSTRAGQPQSVCGVPELDTPNERRGDGWAGGTALAARIFMERLKADLTAKGYEVLTTPLDGPHTWDAYLLIDPAWFDCLNVLAWDLGARKGLELSVKAELVRQADRHALMRVRATYTPIPSIGLPNYSVVLPDDPAWRYRFPKTPEAQQRVLSAFQNMIEKAADLIASYME